MLTLSLLNISLTDRASFSTYTQSPVQVGDYLEFLAETDLRVAASTCPQGDVSLACGGGGEPVVYPLLAQVFELDQGLLDTAGWKESAVSNYSRTHGTK